MTVTDIDNPYWDAVKSHVGPGGVYGSPEVDPVVHDMDVHQWVRDRLEREEYVHRYTWTIPSPRTLFFVSMHAEGGLIDPMAGTGYWGYLLGQMGVDVVNSDEAPGDNYWHGGWPLHTTVAELDGVEAVKAHPDRTLFLSWPPANSSVATCIVRAYTGRRVIFVGEDNEVMSGDAELYATFEKEFTEVASHLPVRWNGMHDVVMVYDRRET
jgi:hypothetical protein